MDSVVALIIVILSGIAALTLLGMVTIMAFEAFGVIALVFAGAIAFTGIGLAVAPDITILLLALISLAVLLGVAVPLMLGAILGRRALITSWPTAQEQSFHTFEQRAGSAHMGAMVVGMIAGAITLVIALGIKFGVSVPESKIADTMNMENLKTTKESK